MNEEIKDISIDHLNHFSKISKMIENAKQRAEISVNSELVMLYWNVGRVIKEDVLNNNKPEFGKSVISELSKQLVVRYGRSFNSRNLYNMVKFFDKFNDLQILNTLCSKLSWSHFRKLITIKEPLKIEFYATLALNEKWSVREMNSRIDSQLFERTHISNKPELTISNDLQLLREEKKMSKDLMLRDPYVLDFLELRETYSEKDLEAAIILELERFILEMGRDFTFAGRQVRLTFENRDYYIDLLLYHRKLKCLVVVELKLGEFKPEYKGQVELYLNYLEKYEMNEGENPPIGIILCSSKETEVVELMKMDQSRIHVAEVITKTLSERLPIAMNAAKDLLAMQEG